MYVELKIDEMKDTRVVDLNMKSKNKTNQGDTNQ